MVTGYEARARCQPWYWFPRKGRGKVDEHPSRNTFNWFCIHVDLSILQIIHLLFKVSLHSTTTKEVPMNLPYFFHHEIVNQPILYFGLPMQFLFLLVVGTGLGKDGRLKLWGRSTTKRHSDRQSTCPPPAWGKRGSQNSPSQGKSRNHLQICYNLCPMPWVKNYLHIHNSFSFWATARKFPDFINISFLCVFVDKKLNILVKE